MSLPPVIAPDFACFSTIFPLGRIAIGHYCT